MSQYNILIKSKESNLIQLRSLLEQLNHRVYLSNSERSIKESIQKHNTDLVFLDVSIDITDANNHSESLSVPVVYINSNTDLLDSNPINYITHNIVNLSSLTKRELYNSIEMTMHMYNLSNKLDNKSGVFTINNDAIDSMVIITDSVNRITYINESALKLLGYQKEEIHNKSITDFLYDDDKEILKATMTESLKNPYKKYRSEFRILKNKRSLVWTDNEIMTLDDSSNDKHIHFTFQNISNIKALEEELRKTKSQLESKVTERTLQLSNINYQLSKEIEERKKVQDQIKSSLEEKEILLREIHHRVKNNLQIISSLLSLQSNNSNNKKLIKQFKESQNRIYSMALIHEHLYESENLNKIEFSNYITKLGFTLLSTYENKTSDIKLEIDINNINLGIDIAIPCGLIVNELISNSIEHAFISSQKNKIIRINMSKDKSSETYILVYNDNGRGISEDINIKTIDSLGLQLVYGLTQQIKGSIDLIRDKGTTFKIMFIGMKNKKTH